MNNTKYNILWIDDQHEELSALHKTAIDYDITLVPFKSMNGGCGELERNHHLYDSVLLDAKFFENENDSPGSEDTKWVHQTKDRILQLPKKFEYFVLTGQAKAYASEEFNNAFKNVFEKGKSDDEDKLFQMLVDASSKQIETQIRHENPIIFKVVKDYEPEVEKTLLQILNGVKNGFANFEDELYFTKLRIVLEHFFRKANELSLLHDACVQKGGSQVNITESGLFLSGQDARHSKVKCSKTHFPKIISENVKSIILVTGAASHTSKVDITQNMDYQDYRKIIKSPYLLYSLAYKLMDVLIWFSEYSKTNSNKALNKSFWEDIEFDQFGNKYEISRILQIANNGWGTAEINREGKKVSIHKNDIVNLKLSRNDKIKFVVRENQMAQEVTKL
ncbi:hypothetical protein [Arenibacter sp. ARW7G5Y1]|uniref:hypothetical protein n=1 Tax=Arenibacter sp. ARW7G5Y1 TaxID=2135619 RepID=UPI000D752074|nr:hypothetical protein [Arenibacter sp. ARW7G5Y1]PXX30403.1 hypothetical protein C7972_10226 [Arenibacter sp. ARW7G5Y1]